METCSNCGCEMAASRYKQCQECRDTKAAKKREWTAKNTEYNASYLKDWNRERRIRVLKHYGGKCECCEIDQFEFLAIDHIDGGGEKHRKEVGRGSGMVNWIINNDFPELFRIMCHNCNQSIGYYGYCPHEGEAILKMIPFEGEWDE